MATVSEHYATHLAPIYVWMVGGVEAALQAGRAEIEALNLQVGAGDSVLDLGAGFGLHSIPLARKGVRVTAVDSSPVLLQTLRELGAGLPIEVIEDDLLAFQRHIAVAPAVILCMGDTITHLSERADVDRLIQKACAALKPGGVLVISFRDYSVPLVGDQRFISVRSDENRILNCFLEYEVGSVLVHDILQERDLTGWQTRVSHYRKLRLAPERVATMIRAAGFSVRREPGARGMVRFVAQKPQENLS